MNRKSYSELVSLKTFEDRYEYLKLEGRVGDDTFGSHRWLNQHLYHSKEWQRFRDKIIVRDNGCDLSSEGHELNSGIVIHHLNPITQEDIVNRNPCIFDPENVVCCSHRTHNAIHYGSEVVDLNIRERTQGDTCLWRK